MYAIQFGVLFYVSAAVSSWNLKSIKISDTYFASSVTLFKNRAFLTLPRSVGCNNASNPTLVEVPWTGEYRDSELNLMYKKKPYPNHRDQLWGRCKQMQNAVAADVEPKRGRLWVLDAGSDKCEPAIVVYNLFYNSEVVRLDLDAGKWTSLVVDSKPNDFAGGKVYVGGDKGDLLVINVINMKMWRMQLRSDDCNVVQSEFLAVSRVEPILYLTGGQHDGLFEMDLKWIRAQKVPVQDNPTYANVTLLGNKLGNSSGLIADIKGGLNYYLIRDYAVLRWDTSKPLNAENHDVLAQSYNSLPFVSALFSGPQNGVWALVNPLSPDLCALANHTSIKVLPTTNETVPILETRVVKILQYNRRSKKSSFVYK